MNQREASGSFTLDQNYLPRRAVQPCGRSSCRYVFVYQQEVILEVLLTSEGTDVLTSIRLLKFQKVLNKLRRTHQMLCDPLIS